MIGHRISISDNLQKLKLWTLCVAMVTDMTSQVPLKYSLTIELQGDIYVLPTPLNILLCNLPSFHKHCSARGECGKFAKRRENPLQIRIMLTIFFTSKTNNKKANRQTKPTTTN